MTHYRTAVRSHVGRVRQLNEDSALALPERGLWAVADGMGGHARGDLASQLVTARLATTTGTNHAATRNPIPFFGVGLLAEIPAEEILCSLANAIVMQNLSVLTRGNTLLHSVVLLGGPNTYLKFLQHCWRQRIVETWKERGHNFPEDDITKLIFVPPNSDLYAAFGAAIYGMHEPEHIGVYRGLDDLEKFILHGRAARLGDLG